MPHQSEAPVRGRTGFSKIGGLLASVPSISRPSFRAACLRKIVWELFFRTGTLATQAREVEATISSQVSQPPSIQRQVDQSTASEAVEINITEPFQLADFNFPKKHCGKQVVLGISLATL